MSRRQLIVHTSQTKRSSDFVAHLEQLDHLYGRSPAQDDKPVVLVEDNGPIHVSKLTLSRAGARTHWLTVEWLPKYAPDSTTSRLSGRSKARHLAHQTFADRPCTAQSHVLPEPERLSMCHKSR